MVTYIQMRYDESVLEWKKNSFCIYKKIKTLIIKIAHFAWLKTVKRNFSLQFVYRYTCNHLFWIFFDISIGMDGSIFNGSDLPVKSMLPFMNS